jgi:type VI secretion system protein ImpK
LSAKEPPDNFPDADRTILIPSPGGRRAAPVQPAAPADDATMLIAPARSPAAPAAASVPAPAAASVPAAAGAAAAPPRQQGSALNALVRAANPLLDLVTPLRQMRAAPDV